MLGIPDAGCRGYEGGLCNKKHWEEAESTTTRKMAYVTLVTFIGFISGWRCASCSVLRLCDSSASTPPFRLFLVGNETKVYFQEPIEDPVAFGFWDDRSDAIYANLMLNDFAVFPYTIFQQPSEDLCSEEDRKGGR